MTDHEKIILANLLIVASGVDQMSGMFAGETRRFRPLQMYMSDNAEPRLLLQVFDYNLHERVVLRMEDLDPQTLRRER